MIAAVVPAAGKSERMGRPKLILPIDGETLIARVVSRLRAGGVVYTVVVAPPLDAPGAAILADDVAGYSRLMGADEEGTLERLKRGVRAISSVVIPDLSYLRNAEHREPFLSGLRVAAGEAT